MMTHNHYQEAAMHLEAAAKNLRLAQTACQENDHQLEAHHSKLAHAHSHHAKDHKAQAALKYLAEHI